MVEEIRIVNKEISLIWIDLFTGYDSISRKISSNILSLDGIPTQIITEVKTMDQNSLCIVQLSDTAKKIIPYFPSCVTR